VSLILDDQLCFALYSTSHAMSRAYREPLKRLGLTYPQYLVMLVLWEEDGISVSSVGQRLFLDSATLTPLLKRLEGMQLVERKRDATDERSVRVTLTESGRAIKREARRVPLEIAKAMGDSMHDVVDLKTRIEVLRDNLKRSVEFA
jgi:DNA-binding MarR family transcriptional regulator